MRRGGELLRRGLSSPATASSPRPAPSLPTTKLPESASAFSDADAIEEEVKSMGSADARVLEEPPVAPTRRRRSSPKKARAAPTPPPPLAEQLTAEPLTATWTTHSEAVLHYDGKWRGGDGGQEVRRPPLARSLRRFGAG